MTSIECFATLCWVATFDSKWSPRSEPDPVLGARPLRGHDQLRINADNSHHRYDGILLIDDVYVVQIELKIFGIRLRRAMGQVVVYKNDAGNGYTRALLCFMRLFIAGNRDRLASTYNPFSNSKPCLIN